MPTISMFYGILIQMFWNDHAPPHFHACYGEYKGIIDINTLRMLEGDLPRRALNLILDWAELHQQELLLDWDLCTQKQMPNKIEPLK
ncbi:TPA: DUF4160 domain-containing protein [Legionella pneumophila]|uniref:DUF4160 domain-containing protein n=1 Tax=Legionella pneumophila TaxID=446 RepID=UPI000788F7EB|nr:DUF4160 domain-containing protein [Legionella pneumophila]HAU0031598.1 DUF4160 domain-containing protein [Legionella pneumophila]HAU0037738.1 DUF4160 domain-containing protein [Legionella pneumophila]HAU0040792.1 DUF4160 domain-containing protein [Legionella pneumophila]HAU0061635.1 DUF4160 domain-containing protein [Legionella pneumophila]HAU0067719.1 DUF4160 domain-containing protein [Legionella pneumophila]